MLFRITLAILCALIAAPSHADEPLSTRQMKALLTRNANRTVQRDLLSVLRPIQRIDSGMLLRLRGVDLSTGSYGTEFINVCRRDVVSLHYAPSSDQGPPADTPLRPYGIEASPLFRIIGSAKPEAPVRDDAKAIWQKACQKLPEDDGRWFKAADAFHALQGSLALAHTLEAVRSGLLQPDPCKATYPAETMCSQAVLAAGTEEIDEIASCSAVAGQICYAIDLGSSRKLTITALDKDPTGSGGADTEIAPERILSVAVEEYIIVT